MRRDARRVRSGGHDLADPDRGLAFGREGSLRPPSACVAADDHDHADAAIEGAQHLGLGEPPVSASQPNTGGTGIAAEIDLDADALGQHARDVVREAAAGDVGQRLDAGRRAPQRAEQRA